jgi:hypothetical protein
MFRPRYSLTPKVAKALMAIEADRQVVASLPLTAPILDSLRRTARLLATHFSTKIEGNQLTQAQVQAVVAGEGKFPGRERDEAEVRNYFAALETVEWLGREDGRLTEHEVRTIHGLVMTGKAKATPYRDGQNVIRDARTGAIVYMPSEAKDVLGLIPRAPAAASARLVPATQGDNREGCGHVFQVLSALGCRPVREVGEGRLPRDRKSVNKGPQLPADGPLRVARRRARRQTAQATVVESCEPDATRRRP